MKRVIAYLLLSSLLLSQTELHELLKLPALISHYCDHLKENQTLSFTGFLHDHYSDHHHCMDDHGHSDHLPFQDCHNCSSFLVSAVIPSHQEFEFPTLQLIKICHCSRLRPLVSESFSEIWQPPKL